jgi:Uma2 family endonuclease
MIQIKDKLITNEWITADWDTYVDAIESPERIAIADGNREYQRGYYYNGKMRIEDMPTGADRADLNGLIYLIVTLFCAIKEMPIRGLVNCSYRKVGIREFQPDISFYSGDSVRSSPIGKSVVDLDVHMAPNLIIEISNTTLPDDLGQKRLLYEDMGIPEYWVIDVQNNQAIAFTMSDRGSKRIDKSLVLPELSIDLITEALDRSQELDRSQVTQWLMTEFQR